MKYFFYSLLTIFGYMLFGIHSSFAAIDLNVTPIKYEINTQTGATTSYPATLVNNGPEAFTIYTGKSDFVANGTDGTPKFVRYSELVYSDQQLSTWIDIDTESFVIGPGESKTINFTIDVPEDATPGGHYGAVFFKNNASENSTGGNVSINVDYGIIILVNVDGEVITTGEVREPQIIYPFLLGERPDNRSGNSSSGNSIVRYKDNCAFIDFTPSNIDGECIATNIFRIFDWRRNDIGQTPLGGSNDGLATNISNGNSEEENNNITNSNTQETENKEENNSEEEFEIIFEIPFENTGNSHIKPKGSVTLVDEDGNTIKQIGREVIINDNGAVIGDKIVDYIPINDTEGNVLPKTLRVFEGEWKGFPYKKYDESGEQVTTYWTPGEYYTNQNISERQFLNIWERVSQKQENKKITALINVAYTNHEGEEIEFNSAQDFEIQYVKEYIGVNPYVILFFIMILVILLLVWIWFWIIGKRKKKCKHCKAKVRKNWKVCPKCKKKIKK